MLNWTAKLRVESVIDVYALVLKAEREIRSSSITTVELAVEKVFLVSAASACPIVVEDCMRPPHTIETQKQALENVEQQIVALTAAIKGSSESENEEKMKPLSQLRSKKANLPTFVEVELNTRLDNRVIDLRVRSNSMVMWACCSSQTRFFVYVFFIFFKTPASNAIFKLQSGICALFREFLLSKNFMEIHSPKLIGAASEGGSSVFQVQYFKQAAYLAQSPQFYKQMAVCAGFERVFEIGPVFRADNAQTARHLTEFVGLDMEMVINQHYHEIVEMLWEMFVYIFKGIETRYQTELQVYSQQYPFTPLRYSEEMLRLEYSEAVQMLRESGEEYMDELGDINIMQERLLGRLVLERYGTEFYVLDKFPAGIRAFYSMPSLENPKHANAYDFFVRGQEILSGAQRVHQYELLVKQAKESGIEPESIHSYLESFKYGVPPHGGGGVGLERLLMLYLGTGNIRRTSLFPRDPHRLTP
jgi:aspartyl-tRNA synthetase